MDICVTAYNTSMFAHIELKANNTVDKNITTSSLTFGNGYSHGSIISVLQLKTEVVFFFVFFFLLW